MTFSMFCMILVVLLAITAAVNYPFFKKSMNALVATLMVFPMLLWAFLPKIVMIPVAIFLMWPLVPLFSFGLVGEKVVNFLTQKPYAPSPQKAVETDGMFYSLHIVAFLTMVGFTFSTWTWGQFFLAILGVYVVLPIPLWLLHVVVLQNFQRSFFGNIRKMYAYVGLPIKTS